MRRTPVLGRVAALVAVLLLVPLTITAAQLRDAREAEDDVADLPPDPHGVVAGLQDERNATGIELLGLGDAIVLPATMAESRVRTDEAVADFRSELEADDAAAAAYAAALDDADGLAEVRAIADALLAEAPGSFRNADAADESFARYTEVLGSVLDAGEQAAVASADPQARDGVVLVMVATRQVDLSARLVRSLLVDGWVDGGIDTGDEVAAIAALEAEWAAGNAQLRSAPPPFDAVVAAHFPEDLVADLDAAVDRAVDEGTVRLDELPIGVGSADAGGFAELRAGILEELRRQGDRDGGSDGDRDRLLVLLLAQVAAILTLAVVAAVTWRSGGSTTVVPSTHTGPAT